MKKIISLFMLMMSFLFVSCGTVGKDEIKTVTAQGLAKGVSSFMLDKEIVKCDDQQVFEDYVLDKTCHALKASCGSYPRIETVGLIKGRSKGLISRFICKSAVKVVMPVIMPSKHLPSELKQAGCKAIKIDELTKDMVPKLCDRL